MVWVMLDLHVVDNPDVPIYTRIADAVCEAVAEGRIIVGDRLPTESALSKQMKISRMTVSRAYEQLQSQGIIVQKRGSGTFVAPAALQRVRRSVGREVANLTLILGETSLAKCRRQTLFILTDVLEGIGELLGEREHHWTFCESLTPETVAAVTEEDAIIHLGHRKWDAAIAGELQQRGVRVLSVMESHGVAGIPNINYDHTQSATMACRHLVECGYTQIGYLGRKSHDHIPTSPKFNSFINVLHETGLEFSARHVREVSIFPGRAYAAAREVIEEGDLPEAFFVDTDYKAMEVIGALNDAGIRVPDDIGIVSYDNIPEAASFTPALTSVQTPRREIGRRAAQMLWDWPADGSLPEDILLEAELIVRNSTLPVDVTVNV
jgi:GntR family transcriptional regulator, arabinose operon transcriptional repressor